jgi:hypothetical protein
MLEDLVSSYHFGGGQDGEQEEGGEGQRRQKTKKEVRCIAWLCYRA